MDLRPMEIPFEQKTLLLGIGGQRCGSTWLYRYLKSHPEIWMSDLKEMHFWDEIYRSGKKPRRGGKQLANLRRDANRPWKAARIKTIKQRIEVGTDPTKYI